MGFIGSLIAGMITPLLKWLVGMFQKPKEEVVREAYEKKEVSAINSTAAGDEHGLVVSDSANTDKWEIDPIRPATSVPPTESAADGGDAERPTGPA